MDYRRPGNANVGPDGKYRIPTEEGQVNDWRNAPAGDLDCDDIVREIYVGSSDPRGFAPTMTELSVKVGSSP
jgi:hypothetical protein